MLNKFIEDNLNLFIVEENINETYNNIKQFATFYTILETNIQQKFEKIFDKQSAKEITNIILEIDLKSNAGLFFNNLKSVFFDATLSKKLGLTSFALSMANLLSQYGLSNLILSNKIVGLSPTISIAGKGMSGIETAGIFSIGAMLLLYIGATVYKMIGTNSIVLIKNFEECIGELVSDLKRFNENLNSLNDVSNKLYEKTADMKCGKIEDKKQLLLCGSKNYMSLCSNYVIPEIFRGYYLYLKSKNYDIGYISSAADLFYYKNSKDRISYYAEKMYTKYHEIFDNILKDEKDFKSKCINELNNKCMSIIKQERKK